MLKDIPSACQKALSKHLRPELFKALSDANRLVLLAQVMASPKAITVTEAGSCCGIHVSGVSRHLAILREAGVITAEKRGREVVYRADARFITRALRGLADAIDDCCQNARCCNPNPKGEEND